VTLLLALANQKTAVLVADRRITSSSRVVDDEHNKLCVLFCDDAKATIAYTGVATYGAFDTSKWIVTTLSDIGATVGDLASIVSEFRDRIGKDFASLVAIGLPKTTFLMCGFLYADSGVESRIYVLRTPDSPGDSVELQIYADSSHKVISAGATSALPKKLEQTLRGLLDNTHLNSQSLLRFALKHMRNAARDSRSGGLVGEQFNAALMSAEIDTPVISTYHSATISHRAYSANVVVTRGMVSLGAELHAGQILAGPEIRPRDPCWCGSGDQFRDCHRKKFGAVYARLPQFRQPLSMVVRLQEDVPRRSGRLFMVTSGIS
jgi:hypothetical protein